MIRKDRLLVQWLDKRRALLWKQLKGHHLSFQLGIDRYRSSAMGIRERCLLPLAIDRESRTVLSLPMVRNNRLFVETLELMDKRLTLLWKWLNGCRQTLRPVIRKPHAILGQGIDKHLLILSSEFDQYCRIRSNTIESRIVEV